MVPLEFTDEERETLAQLARRAKPVQALATCSRIVLASGEGLTKLAVTSLCGVESHTAAKWRRLLERRLDGLVDEPRLERPTSTTVDQVEDVVMASL